MRRRFRVFGDFYGEEAFLCFVRGGEKVGNTNYIIFWNCFLDLFVRSVWEFWS